MKKEKEYGIILIRLVAELKNTQSFSHLFIHLNW